MKIVKKIILILVIAICVFEVIPQNISVASTKDVVGTVIPVTPSEDLATGLQATIGKLLGFLQIASGLVSILMIAIVGFNYIIATPDVKDEMKKKMLPIIIGLVLVFGAVSIAKFLLGVTFDASIGSDGTIL